MAFALLHTCFCQAPYLLDLGVLWGKDNCTLGLSIAAEEASLQDEH